VCCVFEQSLGRVQMRHRQFGHIEYGQILQQEYTHAWARRSTFELSGTHTVERGLRRLIATNVLSPTLSPSSRVRRIFRIRRILRDVEFGQ